MYKYEYFEMNNMQTIFPSIANLKCALSDRKIYPKGTCTPGVNPWFSIKG